MKMPQPGSCLLLRCMSPLLALNGHPEVTSSMSALRGEADLG
jgi:hypothetical protein